MIQRPWTIQSPTFTRPPQYDFDAWLYLKAHLPSSSNNDKDKTLFPQLAIAAQDIKFAFNAYNFVRVCRFYGVTDCSVVSPCQNSTPPMDIAARGNRIFHLNCSVNTPLKTDRNTVKVGLTAHPTKGICIEDVDWNRVLKIKNEQTNLDDSLLKIDWMQKLSSSSSSSISECDEDKIINNNNNVIIQLIVGMENGMSDEIADQCDFCVHIPQFGSIGSLSMINALTVAMHQIHTALRGNKAKSGKNNIVNLENSSTIDQQQQVEEICEGPDTCNIGKLYPHTSNLLGKNDATINHNLARQRKQNFPLQLSLVWWNNLGDRNIGASIRNANIYNVEHMIILNRKKYSRRGTVGCHHYTPVHHLKDLKEVNEMNLLEGYEKWCLINEYPYLCNYLYAKKHGIKDLNLVCGKEDASYYYKDEEQNGETKKTTLFLDDEVSIVRELKRAKGERKAKGIAIFVPDEGSTLTPEMDAECSVKIRMINPEKIFGGEGKANDWRKYYQAGLPGSVSTAVVLDRLRNLIQDHVSF